MRGNIERSYQTNRNQNRIECHTSYGTGVTVRTLADSKLGVDLFRGSASLELYRGSFLQVAAQRLQKRFIYCLSKE
ncbi:hypothetical protein C4D60_Mb10t25700 [Musa balbisiana]|uniref:Uncharacterized protein n=1 Tax=Musa balbisiana TaxID=52838 RepID=A0A4S8IZQ8_MUSBA|nr:hypothetical protein C4D60_Mb10t25700 [Musa balbisiana]